MQMAAKPAESLCALTKGLVQPNGPAMTDFLTFILKLACRPSILWRLRKNHAQEDAMQMENVESIPILSVAPARFHARRFRLH